MYTIKIVTLFLMISCVTQQEKVSNSWKVYNENNFRIEELFIDSLLVQQNFYRNNKIDSFRLLMTYEFNRIPIYTAGRVTPETMKSYHSCFFSNSYNLGDSFEVTILMPVERMYNYNYKIYKDTAIIWNNSSENSPIVKFVYPYSNLADTGYHKFSIEHTIYKGEKKIGTYKNNLWIEKKRKLLYNQFAEDLWDK